MKHAPLFLFAICIFFALTAFDCRRWWHPHPGQGGSGGSAGAAGSAGVSGGSGDLASTFGDDRAGHVVCDGASDGIPNASPGSESCAGPCYEAISTNSAPICAPPPESDRDDIQACDGPEDCGAGLRCCATEWTTCMASCLAFTRCHVDADCPPGGVCRLGRPSAHGAGECGGP